MVPWFLIGGAVILAVGLGFSIYTIATAEKEEPYSSKRPRKSRNPPPPIDYSELPDPDRNSRQRRHTCKGCDSDPDVECMPCGHRIFCREHAEFYMSYGNKKGIAPLCPEKQCRKVIKYIL